MDKGEGRTPSQPGAETVVLGPLYSTQTQAGHAMLPALDAILGHRSAHSFATGPVMAEPEGKLRTGQRPTEWDCPTLELLAPGSPFISPLLFTMTPALSSK